ncbi:MAG: DUF362 domain-containing protein [bacterium]|nr:DUF362 domain-containing protein [bacterium]
MKKITFAFIIALWAAYIFCAERDSLSDTSIVYFTSDISSEGLMKVFEMLGVSDTSGVALKVHFGEDGNQNYIKPVIYEGIVKKTKGTFVETNVLYVSRRKFTKTHIALAKEHGFGYAPIDILDSEGEMEVENDNPKYFKSVKIGKGMDKYKKFVILSHFKGHGLAGFGGAIKNVSMGFASPNGKKEMHQSFFPEYDPALCKDCGACVKNCPGKAITTDDELYIDYSKCMGCGECISDCPAGAIKKPTKSESQQMFLEKLVEYADAIEKKYDMVYVNILANISKGCDCSPFAGKPFMNDIGILASTDIVAIEKASHDLVDKEHMCEDAFLKENSVSGKKQIEFALDRKMGNVNYKIINIDSIE